MNILGLSGGILAGAAVTPRWMFHDSAACLNQNGTILFAAEEERFSRIKQTNQFPAGAIRAALAHAEIALKDIDSVRYYFTAARLDQILYGLYKYSPESLTRHAGPEYALRQNLEAALGAEFRGEIRFVDHHRCHLAYSYCHSRYREAIVFSLDGAGDKNSGEIAVAAGARMETVGEIPFSLSLGHFFLECIRPLGFDQFDEYKAMGLAAYGDPGRYRRLLSSGYSLHPGGRYRLFIDGLLPRLREISPPCRDRRTFTSVHQDLCAAAQAALEEIAMHVIKWHAKTSRVRNACLTGGVFHNCALAGRILAAGIFENVHLPPAAHDAGCAVGATLVKRVDGAWTHVDPGAVFEGNGCYLGPRITPAGAQAGLRPWRRLIRVQSVKQAPRFIAAQLAQGRTVALIQGRAEFGPRALGNRSILGDPRTKEMWRRMNRIVKNREGYRPFAPVVREVSWKTFFEIPRARADLSYMNFLLRVRPEFRKKLRAVSHVNGTSRVQSVSAQSNPLLDSILKEFERLTGYPILLNTSCNCRHEPIVHDCAGLAAMLLTSGLDALCIENLLLSRRPAGPAAWTAVSFHLYPHVELRFARSRHCVVNRVHPEHAATVSRQTAAYLGRKAARETVRQFLAGHRGGRRDHLIRELKGLLELRLITL